jgi:hypothetical protein
MQIAQLAANNALRRCDQLEREKACAEKEGAHLRNEIIVLQKSISVANQASIYIGTSHSSTPPKTDAASTPASLVIAEHV